MSVIVCAPHGFAYRRMLECPWCDRVTRHVVISFLWYDPEVECGGCGHHWSGGERRRQTNKQRALNRHSFQARWIAARTREEHRRWIIAELQAERSVA